MADQANKTGRGQYPQVGPDAAPVPGAGSGARMKPSQPLVDLCKESVIKDSLTTQIGSEGKTHGDAKLAQQLSRNA